MKAKPILMHGRSIQNLLAGRKTQTRRGIKPEFARYIDFMAGHSDGSPGNSDDLVLRWDRYLDEDNNRERGPSWLVLNREYPEEGCLDIGNPYGRPGDLVWVREACSFNAVRTNVIYRSDGRNQTPLLGSWVPSIHMPRWASRLTLHLTGVRVERVQEISEADARAEGVEASFPGVNDQHTDRDRFRALWEFTNGAGAWDRNDWCWVLCFDVIEANVDDVISDPARYGIQEAVA